MARKSIQLSDEQNDLLTNMARAGSSASVIAKALQASGLSISTASVSRRVRSLLGTRRTRQAVPARTAQQPPQTAEAAAVNVEPTDDVKADDFSFATFADTIASAAVEARTANNAALFATLKRLELGARVQARKAASDERDGYMQIKRGSMDAAAKSAREKMFDLVDRAVADLAELPPCPTCGQPFVPPADRLSDFDHSRYSKPAAGKSFVVIWAETLARANACRRANLERAQAIVAAREDAS